ncbi:MAG TPA: hypothetical protein VF600_14760 [Abditibacteriaceae bacterium]|jgi:hypothetical protein
MALPPNVQAAIDEIRTVINSGKTFLNGAFIDEQAFFIATSRLKKILPNELRILARVEKDMKRTLDCLTQIDNLEILAETGKAHVFGKVWINQQVCLQQLEALKAALIRDLRQAEEWVASHPSRAESEVQAAQTEAERIIEDAKREAARILGEAKRNRENPWSS